MSERNLDDVIRNLRMSLNYMQTAEDRAEQLLRDHNVSMLIHKDIFDLKDIISYLEHEYRQSHYGRR